MDESEPTALERQLAKVRGASSRVMGWFPVRVWRRVLQQNGLLLSAGVSYQALFATFAALYVGFAIFGVWFVADPQRLNSLIVTVNTYVPGLIGDDGAAVNSQVLIELAQRSLSAFGIGGIIATALLLWTASSWITYSRMAIRSIFGLQKDPGSYVLLKGIDLIAALVFGALLLLGVGLSSASTNLFDAIRGWIGVSDLSVLVSVIARIVGLLLVFLLDTVVLAVMFLTLSGAQLGLREVRRGALLGGLALTLLQVAGTYVLGGGTNNPLLATFVVFITLLLWFRLTAIVTLTAAAWVAEEQASRGTPVQPKVRKASKWQAPPKRNPLSRLGG